MDRRKFLTMLGFSPIVAGLELKETVKENKPKVAELPMDVGAAASDDTVILSNFSNRMKLVHRVGPNKWDVVYF